MPDDRPLPDCGPAIDRHVEAVLTSASGAPVSSERAIDGTSDVRWYGRLLVATSDAVSASVDAETVLSAAAAIELLGAYCRLRCDLLVRVGEHRSLRELESPTGPLLLGDHRHSAAYSALVEVDDCPPEACFETITDVSDSIVETLGTDAGDAASPTARLRALLDGTAGALGAGAAELGATVAGADERSREQFVTLGRGLGTARGVRCWADPSVEPHSLGPTSPDERLLRRHAERRLAEAERARRSLSAVADVAPLRALVADLEPSEW